MLTSAWCAARRWLKAQVRACSGHDVVLIKILKKFQLFPLECTWMVCLVSIVVPCNLQSSNYNYNPCFAIYNSSYLYVSIFVVKLLFFFAHLQKSNCKSLFFGVLYILNYNWITIIPILQIFFLQNKLVLFVKTKILQSWFQIEYLIIFKFSSRPKIFSKIDLRKVSWRQFTKVYLLKIPFYLTKLIGHLKYRWQMLSKGTTVWVKSMWQLRFKKIWIPLWIPFWLVLDRLGIMFLSNYFNIC